MLLLYDKEWSQGHYRRYLGFYWRVFGVVLFGWESIDVYLSNNS